MGCATRVRLLITNPPCGGTSEERGNNKRRVTRTVAQCHHDQAVCGTLTAADRQGSSSMGKPVELHTRRRALFWFGSSAVLTQISAQLTLVVWGLDARVKTPPINLTVARICTRVVAFNNIRDWASCRWCAFHYFSSKNRMGKIAISFEKDTSLVRVLPAKYDSKFFAKKT